MRTTAGSINNKSSSTGSSQACAACKYQRRKCAPDCRLAPHFPSHAGRDFLNAHKLFGVSNILKALKSLDDFDLEKAAVKSMIYQANARVRDPVGGCHRIICQLKNQIQSHEMELQFIKKQIAVYRGLASSSYSSNPSPMYNAVPVQFRWQNEENLELVQQINQRESEVEECASRGIVKIEASSSFNGGCSDLSSSALSGRRVQPFIGGSTADGKQPFADDVSEDIKPFLGGFYERDNADFLDSKDLIKCSEQVALTEDRRPTQHQHEVNLQDFASQSTLTDVKEPVS